VLNIHPDLVTRANGIRHRTQRAYRGFRQPTPANLRFLGLSAVHGAAQKLKTEMKRLAAFLLLETSQENLEFGIGQQGPQISAKDSGKFVNYWQLANVVNVNSAVPAC